MFRAWLVALALCAALAVAFSSPVPLSAQTAHGSSQPDHVAPAQAGGEHGPAEAVHTAEGGHHEESIWGPISRLFNFLVLVGVLYYFLKTPIATYLAERRAQISNDLVTATQTKAAAEAQLAELDRKMASLPGELALLRTHGQQEIAAEETRIEQAAAAERERLLEQTRREIDLQLRIAQRQLVEHASNLAVGLATERIKTDITPADQGRLIERYLQQVKK
jgi:F-type H+-transporting ATPase subunit b